MTKNLMRESGSWVMLGRVYQVACMSRWPRAGRGGAGTKGTARHNNQMVNAVPYTVTPKGERSTGVAVHDVVEAP